MRAAFALAGALSAAPAAAQSVSVDVPAGRLADGIARLSAEAGISIGTSGALPNRNIPALRGRMDVGRALDRMLDGSGWRARRLGARVWRIEPLPPPPRRLPEVRPSPPPRPIAKPPEAPVPIEIVVTGRKRLERLGAADAAIQVVSGNRIDARGVPIGSEGLATMVDGLSVTSLGAGRNRLFVRGVADGPFDGFGQASVSVVVDEARGTYDAPDPDLRLVDVDRVELLKGPQGPLYGTGALGGIYRVVTRKPDPDRVDGSLSGGIDGLTDGGIGSHAQAMLNLPLANGRAAVRLVGYHLVEPGWIDTIGGASNINRSIVAGGRAALRLAPSAGWTIDLVAMHQLVAVRDSRYVDGPLRLARPARAVEPHDADFSLGSLTVAGHLGALALTSVTSASFQDLGATYDAASAEALGVVAPAVYRDRRRYRVLNQELRIASPAGHRIDWLVGLSILDAVTHASGRLTDRSGLHEVLLLRRRVGEIAGFGEATFNWSDRFSATVGGRLFQSEVYDEKQEEGQSASVDRQRLHFAPSLSLRWHDEAGHSLFARLAGALRPGGAEANTSGATPGSYAADEISTTEIGARIDRPGLAITAGLFLTNWNNVQADFLPANGLVTTRNAGDAVDRGIELSIDWRPTDRLTISSGLIAHRGRLEHPGPDIPHDDDLRLPVVPDVALRASIDRRFDLGAWTVHATLRGTSVGPARLSFDPGLDRRIPARTVLGLGLSAERSEWSLGLGADNLLDSRADSFGFGNPFSIRATPQRTPIRPRSLSLTIGRRF